MKNRMIRCSLLALVLGFSIWLVMTCVATANGQDFSRRESYAARPLAIGSAIVRQPFGPTMYRLSGTNYFIDWNYTPNFAFEGKIEQAKTPLCNDSDNAIMNYTAYEAGIQGSFSAGPIRPSLTGYFGSGWVNRRESGTLWHEPDTMMIGVLAGLDARLAQNTTLRIGVQSSRWIPFWSGSTNRNTTYTSFGLVHRFNASFGREWK